MAEEQAPPGLPPQQETSLIKSVNDLNRRLRVLEERYTNLRKKLQVVEQNMIQNNQKSTKKFEVIYNDIHKVNFEINEIKSKLGIFVKEIQMLAKKEDISVLKRYIEMWDPLNFITAPEVEKMVISEVENKINDINLRLQQENYIRDQIEKELGEIISEKIKIALKELKNG